MSRQSSGQAPTGELGQPPLLHRRSRTLSDVSGSSGHGGQSSRSDSEIDDALLEEVGAEPWVEAMLMAVAASTSALYDSIRAAVREDSSLVVLVAGQAILQTSTVVLIHGSLILASKTHSDPGSGAHSRLHAAGAAAVACGGVWVSPPAIRPSKVAPEETQIQLSEVVGGSERNSLRKDSGFKAVEPARGQHGPAPHLSILVSGPGPTSPVEAATRSSLADSGSIMVGFPPELPQSDTYLQDEIPHPLAPQPQQPPQQPPQQRQQEAADALVQGPSGSAPTTPSQPPHPPHPDPQHHHHHHHHHHHDHQPHILTPTDVISLDLRAAHTAPRPATPLHTLPAMPSDAHTVQTPTHTAQPDTAAPHHTAATRTAPPQPGDSALPPAASAPSALGTHASRPAGGPEPPATGDGGVAPEGVAAAGGGGEGGAAAGGGDKGFAAAGGNDTGASRAPVREAPSMLVWTSDYFAGDGGVMGPPPPMQLVAGPGGATLLVWGTRVSMVVTTQAEARGA
ncbi:MAG: hypothetical protein WDW36_005585 [Sanguina aurantia]